MPGKPAPIKKSPAKKAAEKVPSEAASPETVPEKVPEPEPEAAPVEHVPPPVEHVPPPVEAPAPAEAAPPAPAAPVISASAPSSAPVDVSLDDVNDSSFTIKWETPEKIGATGLEGYTIEYRKDGTSDWIVANEYAAQVTHYCIKNLTKGDVVHARVVAVNRAARSEPGVLAEPVTIREIADRPKIRMPRALRARYVKQVGEQVNVVIPFIGKPKPVVSWLKNGQPLDAKRVNVRNSDRDSIVFIRTAEREDSGDYEMTVKVDSFEDKATLTLQIVELPGPPTTVKLVDAWGFNASLEWTPPKDNGNTEITGYTVQKADKKTGEWFTVLEHFHRLAVTVTDLVMGNSYGFRVFAENKVGRSQTAAVTKKVADVPKTGIIYKPPQYVDHDFTEPPKFTTPLSNHAATVGYTTKLLCAVRGCPKPKIEWMKNQMIIGNDPKFRQISNQGVCWLEIRKPSSFDGGIYTCRAKNDQGEAAVSCKLEVKQVIQPDAEKGK